MYFKRAFTVNFKMTDSVISHLVRDNIISPISLGCGGCLTGSLVVNATKDTGSGSQVYKAATIYGLLHGSYVLNKYIYVPYYERVSRLLRSNLSQHNVANIICPRSGTGIWSPLICPYIT